MHSREIRKRAVALYDSGLSSRAVSERLVREQRIYVSSWTISQWAREVGIDRSVPEPRILAIGTKARRLYESGMTLRQVATRLGISRTTAWKRLRAAETMMRPTGSRFAHLLTEECLRTRYIEEGRDAESIAAEFECSVGTVYNWLEARGIPFKRKRGAAQRSDRRLARPCESRYSRRHDCP